MGSSIYTSQNSLHKLKEQLRDLEALTEPPSGGMVHNTTVYTRDTRRGESARHTCKKFNSLSDFAAPDAVASANLSPTQSEQISKPLSHLHLHPVSLVRQRWHQSESKLQYLHPSLQRSTKTCMVQQSRTTRHPLIVQKNCDQRTISSSHSACSVFTGAIFVQGQER